MASSSISSSRKILFTTNPQDSQGDISCSFKCAHSLVQAKALVGRQVEIRVPDLKKRRNFQVYNYPIGPLFKEQEWHRGSPEFEEVSDLVLQVIAPSTGFGDAFYHLRRKGLKPSLSLNMGLFLTVFQFSSLFILQLGSG